MPGVFERGPTWLVYKGGPIELLKFQETVQYGSKGSMDRGKTLYISQTNNRFLSKASRGYHDKNLKLVLKTLLSVRQKM